MKLGQILIRKKLATEEQVNEALKRQEETGEGLGDCLVALGVLEREQLEGMLSSPPPAPKSVEDTGIPVTELRNLLLKVMNTLELQRPSRIAETMKLPTPIVQELIDDCINQRMLETKGAAGDPGMGSELRYVLTGFGKERASEALELNLYVGPAPVSLESYESRIHAQKITNERVDRKLVNVAFDGLVIADDFIKKVGPAINSGRSILLYGPPGNGKTTIAERIANIFSNIIYVPHCIQVDGQIIKVFDPSLHMVVEEEKSKGISIRRDSVDRRWVACERPIAVTGGELTLEMLDLKFNPQARFYEAPLHLKALGGTFIIDDFGRQLVSPEEILNRWIVPLQSRVDYLKLHTGKSFEVPFDELIIFSTNMEPNDLMDPAFLRRIPYKLETVGPDREQFKSIFEAVAATAGLSSDEDSLEHVLSLLTSRGDGTLACYQPAFIVDQVICACKYEGIVPTLRRDITEDAVSNLFAEAKSQWARAGVKTQQAEAKSALADIAPSDQAQTETAAPDFASPSSPNESAAA